MVLSTRVSLQWIPEEPEEFSDTQVYTSPADHFVDVRIYRSQYPHIQVGADIKPFDEVFQWVIVGDEEPIEGTNKIKFNHTVNLQEILESLRTGKSLEDCVGNPDVGAFWPVEGSEDRKETGAMKNPATGTVTEYIEIWRSLNPDASTPSQQVREGENAEGQKESAGVLVSAVYDLHQDGFIGRIIRLGNWVQGVVFELDEKAHPLSVMRSFYNKAEGRWEDLIVYGKHQFPEIYKKADEALEGNWTRIESVALSS